MILDDVKKLRQMLGEDVPAGGTEDDTLFTDVEVFALVNENPNLDRASYEGWRIKAARLSSLVDNTEGNVQRKFSQLMDNAGDMIKLYRTSSEGPTEGRTRIGKARREKLQW